MPASRVRGDEVEDLHQAPLEADFVQMLEIEGPRGPGRAPSGRGVELYALGAGPGSYWAGSRSTRDPTRAGRSRAGCAPTRWTGAQGEHRRAAWALRGALGPGAEAWLVSEREFLGLSPDPSLVRVDLAEFRGLVAEGRLADTVALADGDLLAGLDEEWADRLREEHRAEVVSLLESLRRAPRRRATSPPPSNWSRRRGDGRPAGRAGRAGPHRAPGAPETAPARSPPSRRCGTGCARSSESCLRRDARPGRGGAPGAPRPPGRRRRPRPSRPCRPAGGRRLRWPGRGLARLTAAWEDTRAGALRIATLAGEPGIGKTRLAAELAGPRAPVGGAGPLRPQ